MAPKRFFNGISNVTSSDPMGALEVLDPTKWILYHEDFCGPLFNTAAPTSTAVTEGGYTVTVSANATISTATDAGGLNGCVKINTTAADNESVLIQTASPGWVMTAGKKFLMETSFEITHTAGTIDNNEFFIGMSTNQTGAGWWATDGSARTFDDGIGWYSPADDTDIDLICGEADVFDNVTVQATFVTATWYRMTMYYDGTDIYTWVNDTSSGTLTPNQIPVSVVGPSIYLKSGEAKDHQLMVDYITVAKER